eukprot:6373795-Alexandrium_andersonii.AAC.1
MGPHSSTFECLKQRWHVRSPLALLGPIGSIRCSVRSVLGARATAYLPAEGGRRTHFRGHSLGPG